MTPRFDEITCCHRAMDHETPFRADVFHLQPTWRTTMWPMEASQQWRAEVDAWLAFAHTVENPPEDIR